MVLLTTARHLWMKYSSRIMPAKRASESIKFAIVLAESIEYEKNEKKGQTHKGETKNSIRPSVSYVHIVERVTSSILASSLPEN
jgi:hypothetical protein